MTLEILAIRLNSASEETHMAHLLARAVRVRRVAVADLAAATEQIRRHDGHVDAIALEGMARHLRVGRRSELHGEVNALFQAATSTPVVDGEGVRNALEQWAVRLVSERHPGTFTAKRILLTPAMNHEGLAQALQVYAQTVHYADNVIYFALPKAIVGPAGLARYAGPALRQLRQTPPQHLWPPPGHPQQRRAEGPFRWADVLAGDMGSIRRFAPADLTGKTIVAECANEEDLIALRERGAVRLVTTMPPLATSPDEPPSPHQPARFSAAVIEAILAALRADPAAPLAEGTYLDLLADLTWQPAVIPLQGKEVQRNRFAFVVHAPSVEALRQFPGLRWTWLLPDRLLEPLVAPLPPRVVGHTGILRSPTTGQEVEGVLVGLAVTSRQLMRHDTAFAYRRLLRAAHLAEQMGARLMGLTAFTSAVSDAGIAVAQRVEIGVTSGDSLMVAATLEGAQRAVAQMAADGQTGWTALVVGATGAVGTVCAHWLAQAVGRAVLVAPRPERLAALRRQIEAETSTAQVIIATEPGDYLGQAELVVIAAAVPRASGIDLTHCKPGAVIVDLAQPPQIGEEDARLRPDVLVVESAAVRIPGDVELGYDFGLPPGVAHPCLAETVLLALEGRFDDFTRGREVDMSQVRDIYRLCEKHGFELAGLHSFGKLVDAAELARRRALADELRAHPERLEMARLQAQVAAEVGEIGETSPLSDVWPAGLGGLGVATAIVGWWTRRKNGLGED